MKFIADGDDSKYVRVTLRDLEAQAKVDADAVEHLKRELKLPVCASRRPRRSWSVGRISKKIIAAEPVRA